MENTQNMVAGRPPIYTDHQYALTFRIASFKEQQAYYQKQYNGTHTKGEPCGFIFKEGKDIVVANYKPRKSIILPARMEFGENPILFEVIGHDISKINLRVEAKNNQLYSLKVDNGGKCGKNEDGSDIEIDTLGRWLFGVPHCKGHIKVAYNEKENSTEIVLPKDCPKEAVQLIKNTINILTAK